MKRIVFVHKTLNKFLRISFNENGKFQIRLVDDIEHSDKFIEHSASIQVLEKLLNDSNYTALIDESDALKVTSNDFEAYHIQYATVGKPLDLYKYTTL